ELAPLAERLRPAGYRPVRLRPYAAGDVTRTAVLWQRDGRPWRLATGLSEKDFHDRDRQCRQDGVVPADVAAYWDGGRRRLSFSALWVWEKDAPEHRVYLGVHQAQHRSTWETWDKQNLHPLTLQATTDPGGVAYYSGVWRRGRPGWRMVWV